jgi:type IV pilus assembly protein PilB
VAFEDPLDALALEEIEDVSGCVVEPYQGLQNEVRWALATYYPELGLTPPVDIHVDTSQRLGALAVAKGLLSEEELQDAVAEQQRTGGQLGRILVMRGHLDAEQLSAAGRAVPAPVRGRSTTCRSTSARRPPAAARRGAVRGRAAADGRRAPRGGGGRPAPHRRRRGDRAGAVRFVVSTEAQVQRRIEKMYAQEKGRLGETLLIGKKLKREQLRKALQEQAKLGNVKPLGEVLVNLGYVTQLDVDEALNKQRSGGGRLEDTLVQSGKISPEMLAKSLAMQLGYEYVDDHNAKIDPMVVTLVPEPTVRRYQAMPIRLEANTWSWR